MKRNVTLMIVPSSDNQIRMIRGILDFARESENIQIAKNSAIPFVPWSMIDSVDCEGVIAYAESEEQISLLQRLNKPVVNVTLHRKPCDKIPTVHSDNEAIGRLAAEHLLSQGLKQFAVVGHFEWHHNELRRNGFVGCLRSNNMVASMIDVQFESEVAGDLSIRRIDRRALREALKDLSLPIGIFATHDEFAYEVVDVMNELGRSVPFDASVIGVNNNRLICDTTSPTLTSISQSSERIGYLAAELLYRWIESGKRPESSITVPPGELCVRRSTGYLAVADVSIIPVIQFIRDQCHRPISAHDVAEKFDLGRKALDKKFRLALGHSVTEELRRERIRLARQLLVTTDLTVIEIGIRCGFESASGFVRAFRETTGCSPGRTRRGHEN